MSLFRGQKVKRKGHRVTKCESIAATSRYVRWLLQRGWEFQFIIIRYYYYYYFFLTVTWLLLLLLLLLNYIYGVTRWYRI